MRPWRAWADMAWRKSVKVVEVHWEDSMSMAGWQNTATVEEFVKNPESDHRSVGYLERRDRRGIFLAMSEGVTGSRGELFFIPRSAVRRVTTVLEAKDTKP